MATPTRPQKPPQLDPAVCQKEVTLSSALTPEGAEYVEYFCGVEFYDELVTSQRPGWPGKPQK